MISAVLLLFNSLIGLDNGSFEKSFVQADFYIQGIINEENAAEHFWALNEISAAHPVVEEYITHSLSSVDLRDNCFLEPFLDVGQKKLHQDKKTQRLLKVMECSSDPQLYIIHLYMLPTEEALHYYNENSEEIQFSEHQVEKINKAIGRPYIVKKLFEKRSFELSDIFLFNRLKFEPEEAYLIDGILKEWTALYKNRKNDKLINQLMLATIVNGQSHHSSSRMSQDEMVVDLLHLFDRETLIPNTPYKVKLYNRIAFSTYYTGNYRDALQFYRNELIPLSNLIEDKEEQLRTRMDYGTLQFRIDNLQAALHEYEFVISDSTGIQNSQYRSQLMNNLAVVYLNSGDFNSYLQFQLDALDESIKANYISGKLHYLNNLYIYYRRNDGWSSAITYLNEAARIANESEEKEELASIYSSLATYERDRNKNYKEAIAYLQASESLAYEIGNYQQLLYTNTELVKTYLEISEFDKASLVLNKLANQTEQSGDKNNWLDIQTRIADMYLDINMLSEAEKYIEVIENDSIENRAFHLRLRTSNVQSRFYFMTDEPHKALSIAQHYSKEILERLQDSADNQSGHLRMDIEFIDNFQLLTDLLLHLNRPSEALTLLDEIKNISRFSFYNNSALKSNVLNENELIHDFALSNRIERLRNELRNAKKSDKVGINNLITQTITEKNKLKNKILHNVNIEPFNLQKVQRKLKGDEVILYFTLFNQQMYLASITSSEINFTTEEFSDGEIQRVEQAIGDLSNGKTNLDELKWVYGKILADKLDNNFSKLFVIPDGFLYRLPLEVLPTGNVSSKHSYGSAKYLIEDYSVNYINSLKNFQDDGNEISGHETDFLGFGISNFEGLQSNMDHDRSLSSLPFAENEVKSINKKLTRLPNSQVLTSDQGTEKAFRANAGTSRVLHVASHSEVFHPDPLYSVIYLNSGDDSSDFRDDGLIYAYELFEMDLSNDMVMLSSCESGSGSYIQGSGIIGLSRAFTYAGAKSLVMNLWSVHDETASSMAVSFYNYLNQGYSKDAAMRKSKIDYINSNNSDPYLWGSFVVYGDDSPLVPPATFAYWWIIGIGLLIFSFAWYNKFVYLSSPLSISRLSASSSA